MITQADVIAWMGITQNLEPLDLIVPAVITYVDALPDIDRDSIGLWESTTKLAAILLAARWYQRRNSPGATIDGAIDGVIRITKYDSDIARMLHIDGFEKPSVG